MQLAHALQGICGLLVRCFCHGQGILCLGLVHLGNELTLMYSLSLAYANLPYHTHASETHRHGCRFLHRAHIGSTCLVRLVCHTFCLHLKWNRALLYFLLGASHQANRHQQYLP